MDQGELFQQPIVSRIQASSSTAVLVQLLFVFLQSDQNFMLQNLRVKTENKAFRLKKKKIHFMIVSAVCLILR